jgi:membrane-bound lytic murein transglycosylase B
LKHLAAALLLAGLTGHSLGNETLPSFVDQPAVIEFARDLEQRHGFNTAELLGQFARTQPNARVLQLIQPPSSPQQRSWERYRPRFLNERRIDRGVRFWQENRDTLVRARTFYGVPEEVIVAIIGVETEYGRNTGGFGVLEALATLAFHYPRRAEFFRTELEQFLLLARENQLDPLAVKGSFAGAIGIPQFMPGSQRRYAIDFDGDQRVDLSCSVDDAIGSVARFLEQHGWQSGQPVAVPAAVAGEPSPELLAAGIRPSLGVDQLASQGIVAAAPPTATVTLVDLVSPGKATEYWLGFDNFYVITRYNRSSFYAMSVFQLSQAIRQRMNGNLAASGGDIETPR